MGGIPRVAVLLLALCGALCLLTALPAVLPVSPHTPTDAPDVAVLTPATPRPPGLRA